MQGIHYESHYYCTVHVHNAMLALSYHIILKDFLLMYISNGSVLSLAYIQIFQYVCQFIFLTVILFLNCITCKFWVYPLSSKYPSYMSSYELCVYKLVKKLIFTHLGPWFGTLLLGLKRRSDLALSEWTLITLIFITIGRKMTVTRIHSYACLWKVKLDIVIVMFFNEWPLKNL